MKLFYLSVLLLVKFSVYSQNCTIDPIDWHRDELFANGKVQFDTTYVVKDVFGEVKKTEVKSSSWRTYDNQQLLSIWGSFPRSSSPLSSFYSFHFKYNTFGKLIELKYDDGVTKFKYNNENNLIEESEYTISGELLQKHIYEYSAGKRTESNYDSKGNMYSKYVFKYNNKCWEVEELDYTQTGELYYTTISEYDAKGNYIKKKSVRIEEKETSESTFTYDNYGNVLTEKTIWSDGKTNEFKFDYKYDKNNNWVEMVSYRNYIPYEMEVRSIIYGP